MLFLKAWAYLLSPPNLLDLAIKKEKIITKQKALASRPDGNEKVSLPALLAIAEPLQQIAPKNKFKSSIKLKKEWLEIQKINLKFISFFV